MVFGGLSNKVFRGLQWFQSSSVVMMDHHGSLLVTSGDDWSLQPPGEGDPPRLAMGPNLRRWWLGIYSIHIIVGTCYYLHFIIHFHLALTKQSKKTYRNQSGLKP